MGESIELAGFIIGVTIIGIYLVGGVEYTPSSVDVYNMGYNELNETKYNAAKEVAQNRIGLYTDEQVTYANDYKRGYEDRIHDDLWGETLTEKNQTLNTLGIN